MLVLVDAVTAGLIQYPRVLPMPTPQIQAYPMETVIAEKTQALVSLGMLNTRMKDFFDLWFLAQAFKFDGGALHDAVRVTFERRKTWVSSGNLARLLNELADYKPSELNGGVSTQGKLIADDDFAAVTRAILGCLAPLAGGEGGQSPTTMVWNLGGPWPEAKAEGA